MLALGGSVFAFISTRAISVNAFEPAQPIQALVFAFAFGFAGASHDRSAKRLLGKLCVNVFGNVLEPCRFGGRFYAIWENKFSCRLQKVFLE